MEREKNRNCYTLLEYIRWDNIGRARHPNFLNTFESSSIPSLWERSRAGKLHIYRATRTKFARSRLVSVVDIGRPGLIGHPVSGTHTRDTPAVSRSCKSGRYPGNFCGAPVDRHTLSFLTCLKNRRAENTRIPGNLRFK